MLRNAAPEFHQTCQPAGPTVCPPRIRCEIRSEPAPGQSLVLEYLSLVKVIAWQVYGGLPYHAPVELNDLMQAGHLGLVNASHTYRSDLRVPFASYARHRIRGEILDSLRRQDTASRNLRGWQRRMEQSAHDLSLILSREPTDEEVSQRMGVGLSRIRKKRLALWRTASCSQPAAGEREAFCKTAASAPEGMPDSIQERREMAEFVERAVATLPPRSKQVIEYYYLQNLPMKEIGRLMHVNESRVSQIHKTALQRMARGLRASGIRSAGDLMACRGGV
jgi:RNA polymerase sigma factor for flagellar operon FliA